jgi:predicted DNA-binding transcriptional regulator AlpA
MRDRDVDLIWITEAMVHYGHSRNWFKKRIDDKVLQTFPQPGESKVYLSRREIEAEIKNEGQKNK